MDARNPEDHILKDTDMRYFPRWEVNNKISYHLVGQKNSHEGETKDISCAGACIAGNGNITPHQKIEMTLQLNDITRVKLKGHILWVRIENNNPQMGVTFYDTPDEVQSLILQHAFETDKERLVKQWYKGWDDDA
jgi:hypothetical protein